VCRYAGVFYHFRRSETPTEVLARYVVLFKKPDKV
jgi:hypothetical protein